MPAFNDDFFSGAGGACTAVDVEPGTEEEVVSGYREREGVKGVEKGWAADVEVAAGGERAVV